MDKSSFKLIFYHCGSFVQYQLYRCTGVHLYRCTEAEGQPGSAGICHETIVTDGHNNNICNQSRLNYVPPLTVLTE